MSEICRICLSVSNTEMCKLFEECHIIRVARSCLNLQIPLNNLFPSHICNECTHKIEEFHTFHETVLLNERKLQKYLIKGNNALEDFYFKIRRKNNTKDIIETKDGTKDKLHQNDIKFETSLYKNENKIISNDTLTLLSDDSKQEMIAEIHIVDVKEEDNSQCRLKNKKSAMEIDTYENDSQGSDISTTLPQKENCVDQEETSEIHAEIKKPCLKSITEPSTCLTCFKVLESQIDLIKHYNNEHCNENNDKVKPKYIVKETGNHMIYSCNMCDRDYRKKKDVMKHLVAHNCDRPFICKICGRTYKTVTEIVSHKRAHTNYKLECSYRCGFATAYKGALKDHERRHLEDYKYKCEVCSKGFFVKTWFEQHQNVHTGAKPYVCSLCGLAFHMERYLTSHRSTVHPQTSNLKRYVCVHCGHPCDTTKSLADHLKVHGIKTEFLCDECGKTFKNADKLRNHKYTHLQTKPFTCSICSKSFAKKFTLQLHETAHSGERRHACACCGKRYVQKSTLDRHSRKHHHASSPSSKTQETSS